jgi:hypothetical protein
MGREAPPGEDDGRFARAFTERFAPLPGEDDGRHVWLHPHPAELALSNHV